MPRPTALRGRPNPFDKIVDIEPYHETVGRRSLRSLVPPYGYGTEPHSAISPAASTVANCRVCLGDRCEPPGTDASRSQNEFLIKILWKLRFKHRPIHTNTSCAIESSYSTDRPDTSTHGGGLSELRKRNGPPPADGRHRTSRQLSDPRPAEGRPRTGPAGPLDPQRARPRTCRKPDGPLGKRRRLSLSPSGRSAWRPDAGKLGARCVGPPLGRPQLRRGAAQRGESHVSRHRSRTKNPGTRTCMGRRRVLDLCRETRIRQFHHVSTAYVCGLRHGPHSRNGPRRRPDARQRLRNQQIPRGTHGPRRRFSRSEHVLPSVDHHRRLADRLYDHVLRLLRASQTALAACSRKSPESPPTTKN